MLVFACFPGCFPGLFPGVSRRGNFHWTRLVCSRSLKTIHREESHHGLSRFLERQWLRLNNPVDRSTGFSQNVLNRLQLFGDDRQQASITVIGALIRFGEVDV